MGYVIGYANKWIDITSKRNERERLIMSFKTAAWLIAGVFVGFVVTLALANGHTPDEWTDKGPPPTVTAPTPTPTPTPVRPAPRESGNWTEQEHREAALIVMSQWANASKVERTEMCYAYDYSPSSARGSFVSAAGEYGPLAWIYFEATLQDNC